MIGLPIGLVATTKMISTFREKAEDEIYEKKFSELLQDGTSTGFVGTYWKVIQLVRWTFTLIIMVFIRDYYYIQIQLLMMMSVGTQAMMVYSNSNVKNKR